MTFAQLVVKLSKLVKKARLRSVDVVVARNWLKKVFDTLTNMEVEDNLKLRVVTKLTDRSTTTWWDNLKLRSNTLITWDMFVQEFNEQLYTRFHKE